MAIIFPEIIERESTVIVDGYSDRKSLEAAIKDFGRFVEKKFHNGEGMSVIGMVNDGISETNNPYVKASSSEGGYFFEWEKVGCASKYDSTTETIDYKDANWYFVMRFVR